MEFVQATTDMGQRKKSNKQKWMRLGKKWAEEQCARNGLARSQAFKA